MKQNYKEILYDNETIATQRLILRKFTKNDAAAVLDYGSNAEVLKYLKWEGVKTLDEALANIVNFAWSAPGIYAIQEKALSVCIGCVELRLVPKHEKATFAYILSKSHWGKGYMTEALKAILRLCFEDLQLNRVEACYSVGNDGSGKVMTNCGMVLEGVAKEQEKIKGKFMDIAHYGITKSMWENM